MPSKRPGGLTGIDAVAGGISEALVTTAIGLFVAIPAVWMFNYFTSRVKTFWYRDGKLLQRTGRLFLEETRPS